jgi:GAF domain-containing protein
MNALQSQEQQLIALEQTLQILRTESNVDQLISTVINYLQSQFEYRLVWICLYDRLQHQLIGKGGFANKEELKIFKQKLSLTPGDVLEQAVIQQQPIAIADLRQETRAGEWRQIGQKLGIQGTLLVPLSYQNCCFGIVLLGSHLWGISPRAQEKAHLSLLFGSLAIALYHQELEAQKAHDKHTDQVFFSLLDQIVKLPNLEQKLEKIVAVTQEFIGSDRTHVYWYNQEQRYFWLKTSNKQGNRLLNNSGNTTNLNVEEVSEFYQYLSTGQLISIGSGKNTLSTDGTGRLLMKIKCRSLLAAPIFIQQQLVGFLAIEGTESRLWEATEKRYLQASAQILAMNAASEEIALMLKEAQAENTLVAEVAGIISAQSNVQEALEKTADLLLARLNVDRFLLLQSESSTQPPYYLQYQVFFQKQPQNRQELTKNLGITETDYLALFNEQKSTLIAIENIESDRNLSAWREPLSALGVKSLIVCRTNSVNNSGLLVLASSNPRNWQHIDYTLMPIISQQIGQLMQVSAISNNAVNLTKAHQTLINSLNVLLALPTDPNLFERNFTELLAKVLECPLMALITWSSRKSKPKVANLLNKDNRFNIPDDFASYLLSDSTIKKAISTNTILNFNVPQNQESWYSKIGLEQVYIIPLNTGDKQPTKGIFVISEIGDRKISPQLLPVLKILVQQFTQFRQYRRWNIAVQKQVNDLEQLNWYKHRHLQCFQYEVKEFLQVLETNAGEIKKANHVQVGLNNVENAIASVEPVLKENEWQLTSELSGVSLLNLLTRTLRSIEVISQPKQQLIYVHNAGNINVYVDKMKLEYILWELLTSICLSIETGGKIEIWCLSKQFPVVDQSGKNSTRGFVELLIIEQGTIDSDLLISQEGKNNSDYLFSGTVKEAPNPNLRVCQKLLRSWGCELLFYKLENQGSLCQLLLSKIDK